MNGEARKERTSNIFKYKDAVLLYQNMRWGIWRRRCGKIGKRIRWV